MTETDRSGFNPQSYSRAVGETSFVQRMTELHEYE